jgi:hypothetical protein
MVTPGAALSVVQTSIAEVLEGLCEKYSSWEWL